MTIEQKAQRYDEAIKIAKDSFNYPDYPGFIRADVVFPELKESEDEKTRKELISFLNAHLGTPTTPAFSPQFIMDCIAWLEKQGKQGEQKSIIEMKSPEESLGIDSDTYNKIVDECIYGEQKPAVIIPKFRVGDEIKTGNEEPLTITKVDEKGYWSGDLFICDFDEECKWDLVPVDWSDEDEAKRNALVGLIEGIKKQSLKTLEDWDGYISWLKSHKDRVQPQPKQEWGKEDSYMLRQAIKCVNNSGKLDVSTEEIEDWLKSLRSQKQWKPSELQIEALESATANCAYSEYEDCLKELINQLKQL